MRLRHLSALCKDVWVVQVGNVGCRTGTENQVLGEIQNYETKMSET